MPLGTEVGLDQGHIVLEAALEAAPHLPPNGTAVPHFSAHV